MTTYYELLKIDYSAKDSEIRAAYAARVSELGPEGSAPDPERLKAVEKAYRTLIDPSLRASYNRGQYIDDRMSSIIYKYALTLQQKFGYYGEAFGYFYDLTQKGYVPAVEAIKKLANAVIQKLPSPYGRFYIELEDYLKMAKAFADPSKPYYDEAIASTLYSQLYQLGQASNGSAEWSQVKCSVYYSLGYRLALGVGLEKDEKAAHRLWSELDTEQRGTLIGCCAEDIRERRKRAALPQEESSAAAEDVMSEPLVQFLQSKIASCSLASEKAKLHLELADLFRRLGDSHRVLALLETAAALDSSVLSAKDWGLLGDLQQSIVLHKEKSGSQEEPFSRAAWNQPLSSYLQAIKKSRADMDTTLAFNLIQLICCHNSEQETDWSCAELSHDNAKTILSIPDLCTSLKPEQLYALCLKLDFLILPALPTRRLLLSGVDAPQILDAELASENYLHRLLEWAGHQQETDSADTDLVDRLLLLTEMFNTDYAYNLYFRKTLTRLFQTLHLPALDSNEGVISPLLKAACMCASSSMPLQRHCAEKLWQLGSRKAISSIKRFARNPSLFEGNSYVMGMIKGFIVDLFSNKKPLPIEVIQCVLSSPVLRAELTEEVIYACLTELNASGQTLLMQAACLGNRPLIQFLLTQKIDIEQANHQGETAFSLALKNYQFKAAWLLLLNSQLHWHRFLFSLSTLPLILGVVVGLLLFFCWALPTPAFVCFTVAGLSFLFACYQFLSTSKYTRTGAKSFSSLDLSGDGRRDFLSTTSLSRHLEQLPQKVVVAEGIDEVIDVDLEPTL